MDGRRVGRAHRAIRHRLGLRQADVAAKAAMGRWEIVMLEAGEVERCFDALGGRLRVAADWQGAALERLLDEAHSLLMADALAVLRRLGCLRLTSAGPTNDGNSCPPGPARPVRTVRDARRA